MRRQEAEIHYAMRHENIVEVVAFGLGDADNPPCLVSCSCHVMVTNITREVADPYAREREKEKGEEPDLCSHTRPDISSRFQKKHYVYSLCVRTKSKITLPVCGNV